MSARDRLTNDDFAQKNPEEARPDDAAAGERLRPGSEPDRPHGDALRDGTGSRHGVHERGREPDTCT